MEQDTNTEAEVRQLLAKSHLLRRVLTDLYHAQKSVYPEFLRKAMYDAEVALGYTARLPAVEGDEPSLTREAAQAAAKYLEDAHECISNDELADAYETAARFLRLAAVDAPEGEAARLTYKGQPVSLEDAANLAIAQRQGMEFLNDAILEWAEAQRAVREYQQRDDLQGVEAEATAAARRLDEAEWALLEIASRHGRAKALDKLAQESQGMKLY